LLCPLYEVALIIYSYLANCFQKRILTSVFTVTMTMKANPPTSSDPLSSDGESVIPSPPPFDKDFLVERIERTLPDQVIEKPYNGKEADIFCELYEQAKILPKKDFLSIADILEGKSIGIVCAPIKKLLDFETEDQEFMPDKIEEDGKKETLRDDTKIATTIILIGASQSLNKLSAEVYKWANLPKSKSDYHNFVMDRLVAKTIKFVELRGQLHQLKVNLPDDFMKNREHWAKKLFAESRTVHEFRNLKWSIVEDSLAGSKISDTDKEKLQRLYTGEVGTRQDIKYVPSLRKALRRSKIGLGFANKLEESGITSSNEINEENSQKIKNIVDEDNESLGKFKLKSIFNKVKAAGALADKQDNNIQDGENESNEFMGTEEEGPQEGEEVEVSDDGLLSMMSNLQNSTIQNENQASLELGKAKNLIQDLQNMQGIDSALTTKLADLEKHVVASEEFNNVGKKFRNEADIINETKDKSLSLQLTDPMQAIIKSHESYEDLVASISGGQAMHGLVSTIYF